MRGATIRIFLIDGTPLAPPTIEKSNGRGKALDFARGDWPSTFESPSTAAGVVLGRSSNGREAWKDPAGRSPKGIQEAALQES